MKIQESPMGVVGLLFSLSIALWGGSMADYIQHGLYKHSFFLSQEDSRALKQAGLRDDYYDKLKWIVKEYDDWDTLTNKLAEFQTVLLENPQAKDTGAGTTAAATDTATHSNVLRSKLHELVIDPVAWGRTKACALWLLTVFGGVAFLFDIVCIAWWYSRYIYKIEDSTSLALLFLDYTVCAAFATAASRWTDASVFLLASAVASLALVGRFVWLYRSPDATSSDKRILKSAWRQLYAAFVCCLICLSIGFFLLLKGTDIRAVKLWGAPVAAILLSTLGIYLTIRFKKPIQLSAERHEVRRKRFRTMDLNWPDPLAKDPNSRQKLSDAAREGLRKFSNLFDDEIGRHDQMMSRVHAEGDLRVQSYILGVPSYEARTRDLMLGEISKKAWIVGLSHWLDDLVDGREERELHHKLVKAGDTIYSTEDKPARVAFEILYRDVVVTNTDGRFYDRMIKSIEDAAGLHNNCRYLFSGLNRVALGAVIFSPKLDAEMRGNILGNHNAAILNTVAEAAIGNTWTKKVADLLIKMSARDDQLGNYLIGLTTKTAQELAMASEGLIVDYPLSCLYSLLYAPLLYFHDIDQEVECGEMAVLETLDVNYEAIVPWIWELKSLILKQPNPQDPRRDSRLLQMEMAYRCFEKCLPHVAREDMRHIYLSSDPLSLDGDRRVVEQA